MAAEGVDQAMFTIVKSPAAPLAGGANTSFTVQGKLTGTGTKNATVRIYSNDLNNPVFTLNLTATVALAVKPTAVTKPATELTANTATLNGLVNAKGNSRVISFDYGLTTAYGKTLSPTPSTLNTDKDESVKLMATGLRAHTLYHFRVRATGDLGEASGADATFTTLNTPPVAVLDSFKIVQPVTVLPVLANDTDVDGDQATFAVAAITTPLSVTGAGTLALASGKLTFTAKDSFFSGGEVTFSYTMKDGYTGGTSNAVQVTLTPGTMRSIPRSRTRRSWRPVGLIP